MKTIKPFLKSVLFSLVTTFCIVSQVYAQVSAGLLLNGMQQFFDNNGNPLSKGFVYTYVPGTFINKTTWQDANQVNVNTNPIVLDAAGRALIYGLGTYRQVVQDQNHNQIWDAVTQPGGVVVTEIFIGDGQPVGTIKPWAGIAVPAQYAYAYGQSVLRASFPDLFNAITISINANCQLGSPTLSGILDTTQIPINAPVEASACVTGGATIISKTSNSITLNQNSLATTSATIVIFPWGNGNGTTTFNVPDLRGVVLAGRPNMGGTDKGNLTSTYYGVNPDGLNAIGGNQSTFLASTNLPSFTSTNSGITLTNGASTLNTNVNTAANSGSFTGISVGGVTNSNVSWNGGGGLNINFNLQTNVSVNAQGTSSFTGNATPFSLIQPTATINYIIKVTADINSSVSNVVSSLGGLKGDIACGNGLTCSTIAGINTISVTSLPASSLAIGSTSIIGATCTNSILYNSGGFLNNICPTVANSILMTDGSGIPFEGTTLPSGLTLPSPTFNGVIGGNVTASGNWNFAGTFQIGGTSVTLPLSLANGGTNNTLVASNGGLVYSDASKLNLLAGTVTAGQCLLSGSSAAPTWGSCTGAAAVSSVTNSDGTITFSPTTGAVVGSLALSKANTWLANITLDNTKELIFNNSSHSADAIMFEGAGNGVNIQLGASNNFFLASNGGGATNYLSVTGGTALALMPTAGTATIGNGFFADNSGHPYCDARKFGAGTGTPSTDQSSITSMFSTCAGTLVVFPCGTYYNTGTAWNVPANTPVLGAGRSCVIITNQGAANSVFACSGGPNAFFNSFREMTIEGVGATAGGSVPTAGWGIDCSNAGPQQRFENLRIIGTFRGLYVGISSWVVGNRVESIYGDLSIYNPSGGAYIHDNIFDNNSTFNATGGGGFGTLINYNTGATQAVTLGTIASSNGMYFSAVQAGNTAPQGGGLPARTMYNNLTDGTVIWQYVGTVGLTLVWPGTETWIVDNDMTSPATHGILLDGTTGGHTGAGRVWIRGNDFGGEVGGGVYMQFITQHNHIIDNTFSFQGYNEAGATTGFPIWDAGNGDNAYAEVIGNSFTTGIGDTDIIDASDFWVISSNNLVSHNAYTTQFCGIALVASGSNPTGTTINGNIINNQAPGAICRSGTGGSFNTAVGNTVFGGAITLPGTNALAVNNN